MGLANQFSVGVVGAGYITSLHHLPILSYLDKASIAYIADIDRDAAVRLARPYSANAIQIDGPTSQLPDCDIVLLAVPVGAREDYITEFSERNIPILSEKPFAPTLEIHQRFLEDTDHIACNFQRPNFASTRQAADLVKSDVFGDLKHVTVSRGLTALSGINSGHYRLDVDLSGGGVLMETGCHDFSQIVDIFRDYDLYVESASIEWLDRMDVEADIEIRASRNGTIVPIDVQISMIQPLQTEFMLEFDGATIRFDQADPASPLRIESNSNLETSFPLAQQPEWAKESNKEAIFLVWQQFLRKLENDAGFDPETETNIDITRMLTATYETAGDKRGW